MAVNALQEIIKNLYLERNEEIDVLAEEYLKVYVDACLNHTTLKFSEESEAFSDQLEVLREYLQIDDNVDHNRVYYFAMIDTIKNLSDKMAVLDGFEPEDYSSYKYIYPILEVLYNNGVMSVGNIAESLKVERHTLTNAIRRADIFELWSKKKMGRNSYYQITSKGEQSYVSYVKKKVTDSGRSLEDFLYVFLKNVEDNMIAAEPDINAIIRSLNCKLHCSCFSSPMLKISLQNVFKKRNEFAMKYSSLKRYHFRRSMMEESDRLERTWEENVFQDEEFFFYSGSGKHSFIRSEVEEIG